MSREFFQPKTLEEAIKLKKDYRDAAFLAGGTDLIVSMRKNISPERSIIDLSKIKELKGIEIQGDDIKIGAMATFTSIADSKNIREKAIILCKAAESVGSPQIRNRGTIGGNICNASSAADLATPLICMEAEVELQYMDSDNIVQTRRMTLKNFIVGSKKTALNDNEILTTIILKGYSTNIKMDFKKIGRRNALAIARLNGACALKIDNKKVDWIRLVLGSATSKPERFTVVEDYLRGKELNQEVLKTAGCLASDYVLNQTGLRSSSTYKLPVIAKFTASLIEDALNMEEQI